MKKSKLALPLLLAALACSCSESYVPVTIPFSAQHITDAATYTNIYFIDFICDVPEAGINAAAEVRRTFMEEIPFAIGRKVVLLEPEHWSAILDLLRRFRLNVDVEYENSVFFQNVFRAHPHGLFFTGKLKLDIKKMGVVKETRDEKGNRKNAYETVQMWEMEAKVFLIDGDASKVLLRETYKEKLEPAPGITPQFNFNSMFARMTAKLNTALQPPKVLQERFIIKK
jgi:hypothetical protein